MRGTWLEPGDPLPACRKCGGALHVDTLETPHELVCLSCGNRLYSSPSLPLMRIDLEHKHDRRGPGSKYGRFP